MTPPHYRGIVAVLLDIEGTTTPIAFVHDVLFTFARTRLSAYLRDPAHAAEVDEAAAMLAREHAADTAAPPWLASTPGQTIVAIETYARWLMDRDRKSPGLKYLQGHIWEQGYLAGELRGQVFEDVPDAIRRWHAAGVRVAIYSSGSVLAQRRLFESIPSGDLTPQLSGFFDTSVGAKTSVDSYTRVASALACPPSRILFVSDVVAELGAARAAGLQVLLSRRPDNPPQAGADAFDAVADFKSVAISPFPS